MEDIVNAVHTDEFEKAYREMVKQASERHTVKSEHPDTHEEAKDYTLTIVKELHLPNGYIFKDENGNVIQATKIVLEKKKKDYPKTYAECCAFVGFGLEWDNPFRINRDTHPYIKHLDKLMQGLCKLIICREAYWRIGGVEMGLGKPWKPSWDKCTGEKYCISRVLNTIRHDAVSNSEYHNRILAFPTEEMRDAFYENFKGFIEQCKELL